MFQLRKRSSVHTPLTFVAPAAGFMAVMVAMILFYAVNASTRADTLQSWTCRWGYARMAAKPHFGSLCRQSRTALYLSVVLVPLELAVFTLAAGHLVLLRKLIGLSHARKPASPTPS